MVEGDDAEIAKLIKKIARICGQESRAFGNNPLQLKKFLNAAGKVRADGMSIDAILKAHDLPPGGRNNQNLKMLLDEQAASE